MAFIFLQVSVMDINVISDEFLPNKLISNGFYFCKYIFAKQIEHDKE